MANDPRCTLGQEETGEYNAQRGTYKLSFGV